MENSKNHNSDKNSSAGMDLEQLILYRSSLLKVPESVSDEDAIKLLRKKIADGEKAPAVIRHINKRMVYLISSVAAGLLLLFGIWQIWIHSPEIQVIAEKGSHTGQLLPDGSKVVLNADSKITYKKREFKTERNLRLDGEAFFNVARGTVFTVSTSNGNVTVPGTSFNVYSRDNIFRVSCLEGLVQASSGKNSVLVNSGESAVLSGNELVSFADSDISSVIGWIEGEFSYVNSPLNLVFEEIERQFNVKFAGQEFTGKFFTGSFTNKDLKIALEIVCSPMNLNYEIGNNGKISVIEKTQ
jgi:transmembrane sensor